MCNKALTLRLDRLPVRPDWNELFGRDAPLELEIGIGNGEFLVHLARRHPDRNFIGVEIASKFLRKAHSRVRQAQLTNVRLIQGEGGWCLSKLFAPKVLHAIYINFPDPWEKPKQKHRRMVDNAFAHLVASRLTLNGIFTLVTDSSDYAHQVRDSFHRIDAMLPTIGDDGIASDLQDYFPTKYYRKWRWLNRKIFFVQFSKVAEYELEPWVEDYYPLAFMEASMPMPHVALVGEISDWWSIAKRIPTGVLIQQPLLIVKLQDVFVERDGNGLLLSMVLIEGRGQQRFFVHVTSHHGETLVSIHEANRPDVTKGLQLSVGLVAQLLMQLAGLSNVLRSNIGERTHRMLGWEVDAQRPEQFRKGEGA